MQFLKNQKIFMRVMVGWVNDRAVLTDIIYAGRCLEGCNFVKSVR
jgi:hypothetical protein